MNVAGAFAVEAGYGGEMVESAIDGGALVHDVLQIRYAEGVAESCR